MKRKITILFILIPIVCGIIFLCFKINSNNQGEKQTEIVEETSKTTISQEGLSGNDYRKDVQENQIKKEGEKCMARENSSSQSISYTIQSSIASKKITKEMGSLIPDYDSNIGSLKKRKGEAYFGDDGTITEDYSFLFVDVQANCTDKDISMFTPLTFSLLEIDDNIVTDYYGIDYERAVFLFEKDSNSHIDYRKTISPFKKGEQCTFTLIFLVPDNLIDNNKLCINFGFGKYGRSLLDDSTQEYAVLNIIRDN